MWTARFVGVAERFAGLRVCASDADFSRGEGPELRGPVGALLLVANRRAVGLERLEGEGLAEARRRFG